MWMGKDRFGVSWQINPRILAKSEGCQRHQDQARHGAMLKMHKINIAAVDAAAAQRMRYVAHGACIANVWKPERFDRRHFASTSMSCQIVPSVATKPSSPNGISCNCRSRSVTDFSCMERNRPW